MYSKLSILGAALGSALALIVFNVFVHGFTVHLIGTGILGIVLGAIVGAVVHFAKLDTRPVVSSTAVTFIAYGLIFLVMALVNATMPAVASIPAILGTVFVCGAVTGVGYQMLGKKG